MIDRDIEKSLDLAGMKIHCQNPPHTDNHQHFSHNFSCYGHTRGNFSILPGISIIWQNSCNPSGRGTAQCVNHDYQFHQVIVYRSTCRLNDKHIRSPHILPNLNKYLTVTESSDLNFRQRNIEVPANLMR